MKKTFLQQINSSKQKKIFIVIFFFILFLTAFLVRSLFFEKRLSFAIANETRQNVPDLVVRLDSQEIFRDSVFEFSIPCCWTHAMVGFGFHSIDVESKSNKLKKQFSIFGFKDTHIYIGIWTNENGGLRIDKEVYYFFSPVYR
jgi:hypothetical protein